MPVGRIACHGHLYILPGATVRRPEPYAAGYWIMELAKATKRRTFFERARAYIRLGGGVYERLPGIKLSCRAIIEFQCGVAASWLRFVTNQKIITLLLRFSERRYRKAVSLAPFWLHARYGLAENIMYQGRRKEAMDHFDAIDSFRDELASHLGFDRRRKIFLPTGLATSLGGIGHIDGYVKYLTLNNDTRPRYLLARNVANQVFLDYWRDYITIITNHAEIDRMAVEEVVHGVNWLSAMANEKGRHVHVHTAISLAQREWSRKRRGPLLHLQPVHMDLLKAQTKIWGMERTSEFICLHIRSGGFYKERSGGSETFRNADIESYYPLIKTLIASGFWVIRMGDPSAPRLNISDQRLIDYAHSTARSPELDVALGASCRLFVGQSSGPHTIPHAFGRPCCLVNLPVNKGFPWHAEDTFIYKRYYSKRLGRLLTVEEILSSDIAEADNQYLLTKYGVELIPNSPDEIIQTVLTALNAENVSTPEYTHQSLN